jgi:hypothetical protein
MAAMTINEILCALSNANAYKMFQAIARQEPFSYHENNQISPKIYYTAVGKLKKANLVIKRTGDRQYILSNVGKVVWNSLQQIDKSVQLQPALKALDAIHLTDIGTDAKDEIIQVLLADEQIRNLVMGVK